MPPSSPVCCPTPDERVQQVALRGPEKRRRGRPNGTARDALVIIQNAAKYATKVVTRRGEWLCLLGRVVASSLSWAVCAGVCSFRVLCCFLSCGMCLVGRSCAVGMALWERLEAGLVGVSPVFAVLTTCSHVVAACGGCVGDHAAVGALLCKLDSLESPTEGPPRVRKARRRPSTQDDGGAHLDVPSFVLQHPHVRRSLAFRAIAVGEVRGRLP